MDAKHAKLQTKDQEESADCCSKLTRILLPAISAVYTVSCGVSVYRSIGDPSAVAFLLVTYLCLLPLVLCVHLFHETPAAHVAKRDRLKAAVWVLSTALIGVFFCRLLPALPVPLAVGACLLAALTVGLNFYVLFLYPDGGYPVVDASSVKNDCKV